MSNLDEIKVSNKLKNIYDEIFKALCCDSKTATDMVNIWLRFVLKPEYEIRNIHLYLPDEEYNNINKDKNIGSVKNDVTLTGDLSKQVILSGDLFKEEYKEKVYFVIEAQSTLSYNMPYRLNHYMSLLMLSRINELTGKSQSKTVSKAKFNSIRDKLPIVVPVLINQDINKSYSEEYGIEKTDKAGVYIGSFKEFIGKDYRDIVNNVFDFKYIYINLNELETSDVETEEIKHWIKAYNESKTLKELRENLAREGKDMSVVLDTYKKGIRIGRNEGIDIGRIQGINIGRTQGIDIGRTEGINIGRTQGIDIGRVESLRVVAKNMKEQGFSTDIIIKTTGLDKEEIELL